VQGLGFRPFIYNLATRYNISGWVANESDGLHVEAEGHSSRLKTFINKIQTDKPQAAVINRLVHKTLKAQGGKDFHIKKSSVTKGKTLVLPDMATCRECLKEIFDPANRRYLYPFTNCTRCGPRYSIIDSLPYDRENTAMKDFKMCAACRKEYNDPHNRRFHAQPNACPVCGPRVWLTDKHGYKIKSQNPLELLARKLKEGSIAAVKGLGGFHLMADPDNEATVSRLRELKNREAKPLAMIYPDISTIKKDCTVSSAAAALLASPAAPVILLPRKKKSHAQRAYKAVAPGNPCLGVMLPYTPLHHILLYYTGKPLIATSGNMSDEPICITNREALARLEKIADLFLLHNRAIRRPVDDSVVKFMYKKPVIIRRSRGYAPLPPYSLPGLSKLPRYRYLALGGQLKNNIAFNVEDQIIISQHLGELHNKRACDNYKTVLNDLLSFYQYSKETAVTDLHPAYYTTAFARYHFKKTITVQHHLAHAYAVLAEHRLKPEALAVIWDGTGYGEDHTVWGGEFFRLQPGNDKRIAAVKPFRLLAGERAIKEARLSAVSVLYEIFGSKLWEMDHLKPVRFLTQAEKKIYPPMLQKGINSPFTSSIGRLFDAVAAITGLQQHISYEGQAAMAVEFALPAQTVKGSYNYSVKKEHNMLVIEWQPMFREIIRDIEKRKSNSIICACFHNTLVEMITDIIKKNNCTKALLAGGCFQNKYLLEQTCRRLVQEGITPFFNSLIPPNDGGIAAGQLAAVYYQNFKSKE